MNNFLNYTIGGNTVQDLGIMLLIIFTGFAFIKFFARRILVRLKHTSSKTKSSVDDFIIAILQKWMVPLLYVMVVYFSLNAININARVDRMLKAGYLFATTFFVVQIIITIIKHLVNSFLKKQENAAAKQNQARGILLILSIFVWMLGIIFIIDNLGYNITTLVTGLGIGGIAVALAAQTILGDLFSYFAIFFDRPFEIGDFIIVEDKLGVVEYVGIKTTRIRSLSGEQLICSNTYLTNAQVHNYKRMQQRRVVFKISVVFQTPKEKLQLIAPMIKSIITSKDLVNFDRSNLSQIGTYSFDFETVYYVLSSDYNVYMDIQESIYFDIISGLQEHQIQIAQPVSSVYLQQTEVSGKP